MQEGLKNSPRRLEYEPGFRGWMREHPGVLNAVRDTVKTLEAIPDDKLENEMKDKMNFDIGAIDIELQGGGELSARNGFRYYYLKASVQDEHFFIKVQTYEEEDRLIRNGADEFNSTVSAKEILANVDWVEVVEPLFGYQETVNERKQSYFVSKWRDLPHANEVLYELSEKKDPKFNELLSKVKELKRLLPGFFDVRPRNMFYDKATNKLVLYDVSE